MLPKDGIKEITDASFGDGQQVIRRGEDVAVVAAVRDSERRQPS